MALMKLLVVCLFTLVVCSYGQWGSDEDNNARQFSATSMRSRMSPSPQATDWMADMRSEIRRSTVGAGSSMSDGNGSRMGNGFTKSVGGVGGGGRRGGFGHKKYRM